MLYLLMWSMQKSSQSCVHLMLPMFLQVMVLAWSTLRRRYQMMVPSLTSCLKKCDTWQHHMVWVTIEIFSCSPMGVKFLRHLGWIDLPFESTFITILCKFMHLKSGMPLALVVGAKLLCIFTILCPLSPRWT